MEGVPIGLAASDPATAAEEATAALDAWSSADAPIQHEYLEHTADVQLHSWGATLEAAFEQQVLAVMGLITELPAVEVRAQREVVAEGHDLPSLLYNFLDEWLFQFNSDLFVCRRVRVSHIDRERWRVTSVGVGEIFELGRHPQGIEVKAITYSALRITEEEQRTAILVIVDV